MWGHGYSYTAEFHAAEIKFAETYKKIAYNCNIMTIQDWLGLTLTSLSILTIIGVAFRWVIRHYVQDIAKELKPNGGSSLKDQVNRLEKEMKEADQIRKEMNKKIDHMYDVLLDYISKNSSASRSKNSKTDY